jgi:DHA2 family multidrug resistance protein
VTLTWVCAISFVLFVFHELRTPKPFINLRLLKERNFLLATVLAFVFGYGLYASIYFLPYFLSSVQRLDAEQIGQIIMWQGLPQILILPFIPKITERFDNRVLMGIGFMLFGTSALMNSQMTHDWAKDQFFWSQIVRALGQPFIITPLSTIAYVGIQPRDVGSASGLNNMMRNLGGSVGIGTLGALFDHQYHLHFTRIAESTTRFSFAVQDQLSYRTQLIHEHTPTGGLRQAIATIYGGMNKEAFVMSFGDCFFVIAMLFYLGTFLLFFTRRPDVHGEAGAAH